MIETTRVLFGRTWLITIDAAGRERLSVLPADRAADLERKRQLWHEEQAAFRRLHELQYKS